MRRIPVAAVALALALAPAAPSDAGASPLRTLRADGTTFVREDRFLPPADPAATDAAGPAPAAAAADGRAGVARGAKAMRFAAADRRAAVARRGRASVRAAAAGAGRPTVRGELRRLLLAGAIDDATHDAHRATYDDALALRRKLTGARRVALGAVLRNLDEIAASGGLTAARLPSLLQTVARNRQWWASGPLLRNGARVSFQGSRLVWQHYPGEGLQIQWLATFGKANGLWQGGYDASLRTLLDEALALAAPRAGGIAWEYLFRFDGGRPPWVSGLAQGTALQALARAAQRLGEPRYADAARAGLGIFREGPPGGVRVATPAGAHFLIYSFAPGLRVLNAFTQALNGLHDFAALTGDGEGRVLFDAGEAQLRAELGAYDTGAWSRYSLRREADLHYHTVARDFLRNLCTRLSAEATRAAAPAGAAGASATSTAAPASPAGGAAAGSIVPPASDEPAPICDAAQRWTTYLREPPAVALVSRSVRGGRPASVRFSLSKPGSVTLRVVRGGRTVVTLRDRFASGVRSLRWARPPRAAGTYDVALTATDLAGNEGSGAGTLRVLAARRAKHRR